jgi:Gram-negative bacterial TonB protein C-terminal
MNRGMLFCLCAFGVAFKIASAQSVASGMPTQLTIARHTFFDFGPPNDFYEIIKVAPNGDELSVQRALVTPAGDACFQPAKVELSSGTLDESMEELLHSKNPCAIPEKELRREQRRCRKCLVFSGVDVTMQVTCAGKNRQIRTDILDRDLFDSAPNTPKHTSWSMAVLQRLDTVIGPGVMDKPIFPVDTTQPRQSAKGNLVDQILAGTFDPLFGPQAKVSAIAQEAAKGPPPLPTIQIEQVSPFAPSPPVLPNYPPIAKLAHVQGLVEATFDVGEDGVVRNVNFVNESRLGMLQPAVIDSISKWKFPESAWGKSEKASIRFRLNCTANQSLGAGR